MKTGASLALICIGAILAFAVTGNTSFFNVHTAGWVLMLIGVIGLLLPSRTGGWLGRRLLVRRTYPGGQVQQIPVPPYVGRNPGVSKLQVGLPSRPTLLDDPDPGPDPIQETEAPEYQTGFGQPVSRYPSAGTTQAPSYGPPAGGTEVIEDLYEQP
jgi:hypothetical protein